MPEMELAAAARRHLDPNHGRAAQGEIEAVFRLRSNKYTLSFLQPLFKKAFNDRRPFSFSRYPKLSRRAAYDGRFPEADKKWKGVMPTQ